MPEEGEGGGEEPKPVDGEPKADAEGEGGSDGESEKKGKRKKKGDAGEYSAAVEDAHQKINMEQLSRKEELFQIRFIVHKARKLAGAIQAPLVRIHLDTKVLRTKSKKGKNPKWNETLLFSITKTEFELVTTPIEIRVIDSAKSAQFGLIGLYKCDLSVAWVMKGKNLFLKWFALTNPDEPQDGVTGYVNISIQIIPPGEAAADLPKRRDEEIDVSDNVFLPPGINLQPGSYIVKLLNGEDMPQMDTNVLAGVKKLLHVGQDEEEKPEELVDPYAKIEFAGKSLESSVQYCTFDPIWNQQLVIPGEFPSMAEQIVVKIYDNDDYAIDDLIATKLIDFNQISYSSTDALLGFSATFGPAYLPFYGSPREFNEIYNQYDDLNYGVEEGIAYRGRVLLEINTRMGSPPDQELPISEIPQAETENIMAGLRRYKYHLFASFYQGNMICEKENQVEFEVSIGDYGNKFSPQVNPAPSTTQPCNAVYDGSEHHFMPWGRTKPTVILHSQWEDLKYRVQALNTLIWMRDYMAEKMEEYEVLERAFAHEYELDVKFENNLQDLLKAIEALPLEGPDEDNCTALDKHLYKLRMFHIGFWDRDDFKQPKKKLKKSKINRIKDDIVINIDGSDPEDVLTPDELKGSWRKKTGDSSTSSSSSSDSDDGLNLKDKAKAKAKKNAAKAKAKAKEAKAKAKEAKKKAKELKDQAKEMADDVVEKIDAIDGLTESDMTPSKAAFVHQKIEEEEIRKRQEAAAAAAASGAGEDKIVDSKPMTTNNLIDEIKGMLDGKLMYMSRPEKVKRLNSVMEKMDDICFEPQLGIPDVFIWMISGTRRIAYHRIPINQIMYSKSKYGRGKHCGSTGSFFLKKPRSEDIGAHLTLNLWFGKFEYVQDTFQPPRGSDVIVYAETYENQMSVLGNWTTKLLPRPAFSDSTGRYNLPLDCFNPPEGWHFTDEWFISIDRSLTFDNESGLREFTEEVYEGQTRLPGSSWEGGFTNTWWSDNTGDKSPSTEEIECTEGWKWVGEWEIDTNRAVDHMGWEYAIDTNIANYSPIERSYHLSRRRRWQRLRERTSDINVLKKRHIDPDGWEYSKIFTTKFHPKERKFDMVRRRRYNRRLVSNVPMPVVFQITEEEAKADRPAKVFNMAPRIITEYDERQVHKYQLRAYLYQARGLLGADPTGYSDPYARVVFGNRSATTQVIEESVSPVWDTTLVLDAVEICGDPDDIAANPPFIVIELFDEDILSHDPLGRVVCRPVVRNSSNYQVGKLRWYPIGGTKRSKGDLLAGFELFKLGTSGVELPLMPPFEGMRYLVPTDIRPKLQLTRVEVLTWGVRLMKDYKMIPVDAPHIDIEVGGQTLSIDKIESLKKHPNFVSPHAYVDVELPINEEYLPPINIRVMDNRAFGYTPLVAVATIKEYGKYRTEYSLNEKPALDEDEEKNKAILSEVLVDQAGPGSGAGALGDFMEMLDEELQDDTQAADVVLSNIAAKDEAVEDVKDMEDGVIIEIEPKRSDSQAQLVPADAGMIISNPAAAEAPLLTEIPGDEDNAGNITMKLEEKELEAANGGKTTKKSEKQMEKDLKMEEKLAKKEAKLKKKRDKREKKEREKYMKIVEKDRQKTAKAQAKAKYKAEQAMKKKALEELEKGGSSDEETFIPAEGTEAAAVKIIVEPTTMEPEVPEKAAGLLGMWYGNEGGEAGEGGDEKPPSRLSRKETRKKKLEEEVPIHPDDILVSDWWSKYYQCIGSDPRLDRIFKERNLPTIKLYEEELEEDHNKFRDLMDVVRLNRPDNELDSDYAPDSEDEDDHVGLFKGSFKIYPITEEMRVKAETEEPVLMFSNLPNNAPVDVVVRVYIVAGINLTPLDFGGSVDPYLWVKCGKHIHDDKANYQTKKINPEFGKMFESRCSLPRDSQLIIKVYDHDLIGSNDIVGGTTIDLEDRYLSWKRASCGVPQTYIVDKENKDVWRDTLKPIALLKRMCLLKGWAPPTFKGKQTSLRCYVNGSEYKLKYFESGNRRPVEKPGTTKKHGSDEHRLALYVLHELGVVPEHIETRTLYNDDCPGIPQGKIHLWVDIFPYDRNLPPPVDIRPRVPQKYVLRVIVWNTYDVILQDENFMGERMSDIFCKIWMEGLPKYAQETDVHFRSLTGEGNFNWRMTYDFDYLLAEQKVVAFQKENFWSVDAVENRYLPNLLIEIYDFDIISSNDLLGWTELSLVSLVPPTKGPKECSLDVYDTPPANRISIFDKKKIKGLWPVYDDSLTGEKELTGKIELEIEILTEEEAIEKPAGQARNDPNENPTLEPPNRPVTSFSFFMNPFTVFKILIWEKYKWKILMSFIILLCICFLALIIYTSPGAFNQALFKAIMG